MYLWVKDENKSREAKAKEQETTPPFLLQSDQQTILWPIWLKICCFMQKESSLKSNNQMHIIKIIINTSGGGCSALVLLVLIVLFFYNLVIWSHRDDWQLSSIINITTFAKLQPNFWTIAASWKVFIITTTQLVAFSLQRDRLITWHHSGRHIRTRAARPQLRLKQIAWGDLHWSNWLPVDILPFCGMENFCEQSGLQHHYFHLPCRGKVLPEAKVLTQLVSYNLSWGCRLINITEGDQPCCVSW